MGRIEICRYLDEHKLDILLAVIFAILFGIFYEELKDFTWATILLLVPVLMVVFLNYNITKKREMSRLIESLKSEQNRHEQRSIVKKLIKLVNHTAKCFIIWDVWSAAIADLEQCIYRFNEYDDADVRYCIATAIGEIGGTNAIDVLCRNMGEKNPFARLGVTDALAKQGPRAIKTVIKYVSSSDPLVRLSAVVVLVSIEKDDHEVKSALVQLKNDSDKRVRDVANNR